MRLNKYLEEQDSVATFGMGGEYISDPKRAEEFKPKKKQPKKRWFEKDGKYMKRVIDGEGTNATVKVPEG